MAVYSPVTAFLLLVSSALVLDAAIYFRRHEKVQGSQYKEICEIEPCVNVEAAGVRALMQGGVGGDGGAFKGLLSKGVGEIILKRVSYPRGVGGKGVKWSFSFRLRH